MSEFLTLCEWLVSEPPVDIVVDEPKLQPDVEPQREDPEPQTWLSEVRYFQAAMQEAIERRAREAASEIAIEILARELRLSPCDLDGIIALVCRRYRAESPLAIRAHPEETRLLQDYEGVVADPTLRRGDVLLELLDGQIDARLGVRLERVLDGLR